ncbi:MAG: Ig-like domain-containing protein [Bdellovibrionota bacterium]|nr:Ig-like domain-containing protein [Bdellovibrionota bacterium]
MNRFLKLCVFATIFTLFIGCSGGGGDSKPSITYLKITSVKPENLATDVYFDEDIVLNFSEGINTAAFVNSDALLGNLILSKNLTVVLLEGFVELSDTEIKALTYADIQTGDYILTLDASDESFKEPITSAELNERSMDRTLVLKSATREIVFSHKELKDTGLFDQNMIQLKDSSGALVKGRLIQQSGNRIQYEPYEYLDYEQTYTLSVSSLLKSTLNHSLQSSFSSSFTIEAQPPIVYSANLPSGIDNNPLQDVRVEVSYVLYDDIDLNAAIKVFETTKNQDGEDVETELFDLTRRFSSDKKAILVSRENYWQHNKNYIVRVNGNELLGSVGNSGTVKVGEALEWDFETSVPKVILASPTGSKESPETVDINVVIGFNYPVSHSVIKQNVVITDEWGNSFDYDITDSSTVVGRYILEPKYLFFYLTDHKVKISKETYSSIDASVSLSEDYSFDFSTEPKKLLSLSPYDDQTGVLEDQEIVLRFNFPVDTDPREHIKIYEDTNSEPSSFSYRLSGDKKTLTLWMTDLSGSSRDFLFNTEVLVTVDKEIAIGDYDSDIGGLEDFSYNFSVKNQILNIISSVPADGETLVPVDEDLISVTFNHAIYVPESVSSPFTVSYDCNGYSGILDDSDGVFTIGTSTIYFDPFDSRLPDSDSYWLSGCVHEIFIDERIEGTNRQLFETSSNIYLWFETDFLDVDEIRVEFAYNDRVRVDSEFEVDFSHNIRSNYSLDESFELLKWGYSTTYFYDSSYGDEVTIRPSSDLDFGEDYELWVYRQSSYPSLYAPIRSTGGERLLTDHYYSFRTENMPLEVVDYYPYGDYVDVYSDLYLSTNFKESDQGYPEDVEISIEAYYWDSEYESYRTYDYSWYDYDVYISAYDIDVTFDETLFSDADYDIEVLFRFEDGEEIVYSWDFHTEEYTDAYSSLIAQSATESKTTSSEKAKQSSRVSREKANASSRQAIRTKLKAKDLFAKAKDSKAFKKKGSSRSLKRLESKVSSTSKSFSKSRSDSVKKKSNKSLQYILQQSPRTVFKTKLGSN